MKFNKVILEASYDNMLQAYKGILPDAIISKLMKNAKQLGRMDLSVWYLRYATYFTLAAVNQEVASKYLTRLAKFLNISEEQIQQESSFLNMGAVRAADGLFNLLQHFVGLNIPAIANLRFTNQTLSEIQVEFTRLEDEYKKQKVEFHTDSHDSEYEDIVLEFSDGSRWVNLNRGQCDVEGAAMRHCGNAGGGNRSDRVLSLRLPVKREKGQVFWKSVLTFVIDRDQNLTESKGYANNPPDAKYYPKIVALLKTDLVKGIIGGGYKPTNNFHLSDLNVSTASELVREKPLLGIETLLTGRLDIFEPDLQASLKEIYKKIPELVHSFFLVSDDELKQIAQDLKKYLSEEVVREISDYLYELHSDWYYQQVYDLQLSAGQLDADDNVDWDASDIPTLWELDSDLDNIVKDIRYTIDEIDRDTISDIVIDQHNEYGKDLAELEVNNIVHLMQEYITDQFDSNRCHICSKLIDKAFSQIQIALDNGQFKLQVRITEPSKNSYWKAVNEI